MRRAGAPNLARSGKMTHPEWGVYDAASQLEAAFIQTDNHCLSMFVYIATSSRKVFTKSNCKRKAILALLKSTILATCAHKHRPTLLNIQELTVNI